MSAVAVTSTVCASQRRGARVPRDEDAGWVGERVLTSTHGDIASRHLLTANAEID